jgi:hypothetical protein
MSNNKNGKASACILQTLRSQEFSYGEAISVLESTLGLLRREIKLELERLPITDGIEDRPNSLDPCVE